MATLTSQGAAAPNLTRDLKYIGMASQRPYNVQTSRGQPARYSVTFDFINQVIAFVPNVPQIQGPEVLQQIDYSTFDCIELLGMFEPLPAETTPIDPGTTPGAPLLPG
jgi:hypothetical protein